MTFARESLLLSPVRGALRRQGYRRQKDEVRFFDYRIDLYGYAAAADATIAVELKLLRWKRAFQQALVYQLCADFVYLALPASTAERVDIPLLERHGLGLIGVQSNGRCVTVVEAKRSDEVLAMYREFYIDFVKGSKL